MPTKLPARVLRSLLVLLVPLTAAVAAAGTAGPAAAGLAVAGPAAAVRDDDPAVVLRIRDPRVVESSGLAASRRHPGILYTHNDSDAAPEFYAIGPGGRTVATLAVAGASARDWEAVAVGPDGAGRAAVFLGDIGDNADGWPSVTVYRVREPARLAGASLPATAFTLTYEDGPRNAEGLLVHPRTGRLYVVSKDWAGGLYAAPRRLRTDRPNVLRRIADAPPMATDAAFAPDGRTFVVRTYFSAIVYTAPGTPGGVRPLTTLRLPEQRQGESVTYTADGSALLVGSEGAGSAVWRVPLPAAARAPAPAASPDQSGTPGPGGRTDSPGPAAAGAGGAAPGGPAGAAGRPDLTGLALTLAAGALVGVLAATAIAALARKS